MPTNSRWGVGGIRIAIEPNPYFKPNAKLDRNEAAELRKLASANTRIRISSSFPGLLAQVGDVGIYAETRLRSSETSYRGNGDPYPPTVTVHNPVPVTQRILPDTLGNLHFARTGRVNERDLMVVRPEVLGFDIQQRATRMTDGDTPVATTSVGQARAAGMALEKQEMLLVVLPNRDALAQRLLALEQQLNELYQAEIELERQRALFDKARNDPLVINHSALRQKVYRTLNTPILPAFLLMVEGWNVKAELQAIKKTERLRSRSRANFGMGSAVLDAAIALELLAERAAHTTRAVQMVMNGLKRELFKLPVSQGSIFVSQVTGRILLGATAAGLFAGISLADAFHEFALGDNAG
jgi:hypothetical protein